MAAAMRLGAAYLAICAIAFLLHAAGGLSRAELAAYDWLLRSRPSAPVDARILIRGATFTPSLARPSRPCCAAR